MHINWNSRVSVPKFEDDGLNRALRKLINEATDDHLLSVFLHFAEGRVAEGIYGELHDHHAVVEAELEHANRLRGGLDTPTSDGCVLAHHRLREILRSELADAKAAMDEAAGIWHTLRQSSGADLRARFGRGADTTESGLERAGWLRQQLATAGQRVENALDEHCEELHRLALLEAEYRAFTKTPDSISADDFDSMTPIEFEEATAALVHRDGLTLVRRNGGARDLGADVIAVAPDGRKIVIQCKYRSPGGRPIGSPVIQTLNGTARPVHAADIVIALTNRSFTEPARELAAAQNIHLLFGHRLRRWATWGMPLLEVLGEDRRDSESGAAA